MCWIGSSIVYVRKLFRFSFTRKRFFCDSIAECANPSLEATVEDMLSAVAGTMLVGDWKDESLSTLAAPNFLRNMIASVYLAWLSTNDGRSLQLDQSFCGTVDNWSSVKCTMYNSTYDHTWNFMSSLISQEHDVALTIFLTYECNIH